MKRNSAQVSGTIVTPTGTPQLRNDGAETTAPAPPAGGPILLTRKKERPAAGRRLPLDLQPDPAAMEKTPPPVRADGAVAARHGGARRMVRAGPPRQTRQDDWAELDIDAPRRDFW